MHLDLSAFARDVAPHIDRLAIAVHQHARPAGRALISSYGLPNAGVLIDVRALLLDGPITLEELATIERYAARDRLHATLDEHVCQGMLQHTDSGRYALTGRGQALLSQLTTMQGQTITSLWSAHASQLPTLVGATTRAIDAAGALPNQRYPAFYLMRNAPDPPQPSPAHLLLTRLTTLRYLRADAHAAAWAAHGRLAPHAEPAERASIEAETNDGAAPPWAALTPAERTALLDGLIALPG